jgi:hypothetical protein
MANVEDAELWSRLRRRKVVQWGIAYAAGSWGFLQGLAYLSTVFQWTGRLQRPATVVFLVGLPIALVLAWYHGDRGHQKVSANDFTCGCEPARCLDRSMRAGRMLVARGGVPGS